MIDGIDQRRWGFTPTLAWTGCRVCGRKGEPSENFYYDRDHNDVVCPACFEVGKGREVEG